MKFILLMCVPLFFISCTSMEKKSLTDEEDSEYGINVDKIEERLEFSKSESDLGFEQKTFNTCEIGAGYPSNAKCSKRYFAVLHMKVLCRDSVGTVQKVNSLEALQSNNVKVIFGNIRSYTSFNMDGYTKLRGISKYPFNKKKLILKKGQNALQVSASEVSKIIVPNDWCS